MPEFFHINNIDSDEILIETQRVRKILSHIFESASIHEVGSTSVDGIIGKQDIDFLVRVAEAEFSDARRRLDSHFSRNPQQLSNDIYQGYTVVSTLDVAVQLTTTGGRFDNFLEFRDLLKSSPEIRNQYNQLKREFNGLPMREYQDAKHAFIHQQLGNK